MPMLDMDHPITLYTHRGPNPPKVAIVLEELGLSYTSHPVAAEELKAPEYEKINPNGRAPAIQDPNTGVTVWESGAIIKYLIETYDTEKRLTYTTTPEKFHVDQWLFFQVSGQGPYFGQSAWFIHIHPEKLPSAMQRYQNESKRVLGVLNRALEGKEYLVGDKCTIADLSFMSWNKMLPFVLGDAMPDLEKEYPNFYAWNKRVSSRPTVFKVLEQSFGKTKK